MWEYAYTTGALGAVLDTIIYDYGNESWGDLLTSYDGNTITYDTIGNPLSDGTWTYTWEQGRQLAKMQGSSETWNYSYDTNGLRTQRSNGTATYRYWYSDSGLPLRMEKGNTVYSFTYDAVGRPVAITEGNTRYFYVLNQQGDVVAIINGNGDFVVEYYYDAWGRLISTSGTMSSTLGKNNPLRYRGYVYDTETGLYYLQSRYYNPIIGRFINADDPGYMGVDGTPSSYNLFAYCGNNPVTRADYGGGFWDAILDLFSLGASIFEVCKNPTDGWAWVGLIGDTADVFIPFLGGLGEASRTLKATSNAVEVVDSASDAKRGWKVGDDITKLTRKGDNPSWTTVRQRYWKNEAALNPGKYTPENLSRLKAGRPPLVELNGKCYPMELHHKTPRHLGGRDSYDNLVPLTPWEHAEIDPFRYFRP